MKPLISALTAATLLTAAMPATAERLDPITVTGNLFLSADPFLTSYPTQTYTAEDIRESGATSLREFLNTRTAVLAPPNAGNTLTPKLNMPGYGAEAGFESVKVIVDGTPLNNIDLMPALLASIDLESIQSVTIVQGAGSVEYGDNALAGAVIIRTRQGASGSRVLLNAHYGAHAEWRRSLSASLSETGKRPGERFYFDVTRERTSYDGDRAIKSDGTRNARHLDNLHIRLGMQGARYRLQFAVQDSKADIDYPGALTLAQFYDDPATNPDSATPWKFDRQARQFSATFLPGRDVDIRYWLDANDQRSEYPSYASQYDYEALGHRLELVKRFEGGTLRLGGALRNAVRKSASRTEKNTDSLYAKATVRLSDATRLDAGIRHENAHYRYRSGSTRRQDDQDAWCWNIGINHAFDAHYALFANINRGYALPNIDRFFTFSGAFNGFIEPMSATLYTAGIKFRTGLLQGTFYGSYHDLENEFYYDASSGRNTNLKKTHKIQFGADLVAQIGDETLTLNAVHTRAAIDRAAGVDVSILPGAPENAVRLNWTHTFSAPWFHALPQQRLTLSHQWTSEALAESDFGNAAGYMPGQRRTDLNLSFANRRLTLQAGVKNLFEEHNASFVYSSFSSAVSVYPIDYERTYYIGLKYDLEL